MASAWEIREANQVAVAILHVEQTTIAWSFGLRNLKLPGKEELRRFNPFIPLTGMPFDHARNKSVEAMLSLGAEWLFSLDSDVVPPRDAVLRLLAHKHPFISGLYTRRSPPRSVPVAIRNGGWMVNFKPGAVEEVDLVGAGCLLIHRSIFESLPPQRPGHRWFDWRVNYAGLNDGAGNPLVPPGDCLSEDFTLCKAVREKLGIKVLVDTSVMCKHVGMAESTFGRFEPLDTSPHT